MPQGLPVVSLAERRPALRVAVPPAKPAAIKSFATHQARQDLAKCWGEMLAHVGIRVYCVPFGADQRQRGLTKYGHPSFALCRGPRADVDPDCEYGGSFFIDEALRGPARDEVIVFGLAYIARLMGESRSSQGEPARP